MAESRLRVILPVHNNEGSLGELCRRLQASLVDFDLGITVVDDWSTDNSAKVASGLDVILLTHDENLGQNAAILTGLKAAFTEHYVVVMDADLQDLPEGVPALIQALEDAHADVVFSARGGDRRISSMLFRTCMKLLYPGMPFGACLHFACRGPFATKLVAAANDSDYLVAVMGELHPIAAMVELERGVRSSGVTGYPGWRRWRHAGRLLSRSMRRRWKGLHSGTPSHDEPVGPD